MTAHSAALVCSNLNSASQDNAGLAQWHAVGMARAGPQYYVYSSTFDPADYPASSPPPRLSGQPGCINAEHIIQLMRTPQSTTYPPIRGVQGHPVRGRGLTVADIWITGSGNTRQQCIGEGTRFIYEVGGGRAGISTTGPIIPNPAGYNWVRATW